MNFTSKTNNNENHWNYQNSRRRSNRMNYRNNSNNSKIFIKKRESIGVENTKLFPDLSNKTKLANKKPQSRVTKATFLNTLKKKDSEPTMNDTSKKQQTLSNLPYGWVKLGKKTNADIEREQKYNTIETVEDNLEKEVTGIMSMLRQRQTERDYLNELLEEASPYYYSWDLLGPPGVSEEEYETEEEDTDNSSTDSEIE